MRAAFGLAVRFRRGKNQDLEYVSGLGTLGQVQLERREHALLLVHDRSLEQHAKAVVHAATNEEHAFVRAHLRQLEPSTVQPK